MRLAMAHKQFIDSKGTEWFVFDVTPRADERRSYDRRRDNRAQTPDDRRSEDRRVAVSGQRPPRLTKGWLCFEREGERRRLQPIPDGWTGLTDAELEELVESASVAPVRKRPIADTSAKER
jgi:hypothetical protein